MALQEDDQLSAEELELESNHEPYILRFHRYAERAARKCVQEPSYPCEEYAKMIYDYASGQYPEIREPPVDDGKNVVEHGRPLSHRRPIGLLARHRGLRRELRNLSMWRNSLLQHMEIVSHDIDLQERGRSHSLQAFSYGMSDTLRELQSETRLEGAHVDELYNILSAILQLSTICEAKAADTEGCRKQTEKCLLEQLDNPRKILHGSTKMAIAEEQEDVMEV
ncbi:hypothetical protein AAL_02675 [Moelleriella libera RCEF 2490]|uniref:Uncharacterized protein n=1 Tax=Moelleriella libera RCEF 2490 TaxID=1081109 RepID=A0A168ET78_9HYPO|nr:hypothetical protein AAL_02675 [Moelleriella libera RCEF 2490]